MAVDTKIILTASDKTRAAFASAQKSMEGIKLSASTLTSALSSLGVGLSFYSIVGKLVSVQREFDVLNSSLITVTGSSAAAEKEFAWIKEFAATTPFALNEVAQAFVKMKSMGMDASMEVLESYGNTASAMGKSLNQMIEAVADAGTGEFERLKEFGIKAKKQGDDVTLVFQGVATKIKNNSEEITGYLKAIGNTQFAGAMAERSKTLDGALSNLGDTWDELFRTVNNSNTGGLIFDSVKTASAALEEISRIIRLASPDIDTASGSVDKASKAFEVFSTVAETLAISGANISFVFRVLANDVASSFTAIGYAMTGQFNMAKKTLDQAAAYAQAERDKLDRLERGILSKQALPKKEAPGVTPPSADPDYKPPVSPEEAAKFQDTLEKAFNLKPLDDFIAGFSSRASKIKQEYAKLALDIGGRDGPATGSDISSDIVTAKGALAGGDTLKADALVERAKAGLKDLASYEQSYYARQLQDLELSMNSMATKAAEASLESIRSVQREQAAELAKMDPVHVPIAVEAIAQDWIKVMDIVRQNLIDRPFEAQLQLTGTSDISRAAAKLGAR